MSLTATVDRSDPDELITGEAVALSVAPTSFVLRATGLIIDFLCCFLLYIGINLLLVFSNLWLYVSASWAPVVQVAALVFCLLVLPTLIETVTRGKSLGKLVIGGRIVRDDGGAIGFRHAFTRALVGLVEIYLTLGLLAAISGLVSERAKRLGDLVAGTYCQYERVRKEAPPIWGVPTPLTAWAQAADVARLPDGLARRMTRFLRTAHGLAPASRQRLALTLAQETARYVSPIPDVEPELFLAAVTAVRRERELRALRGEQARLMRAEAVLTGRPHRFPDRA